MTSDTHPQTPSAREGASRKSSTHTPKPRKLALSLATAGILAGASLDIAAAACNWKEAGNKRGNYYIAQEVNCSGTWSTSELQSQISNNGITNPTYYYNTTWNLGGTLENSNAQSFTWNFKRGNSDSNPNKLGYFTQTVNFSGLSAAGASFTINNTDTSNPINLLTIGVANSTLGSLSVGGSVNSTMRVNASNMGSLTISSGAKVNRLSIGGQSNISSLTIQGDITSRSANVDDYTIHIGGGSLISSLSITGTVKGNLAIGDRGVINSGFTTDFSNINNKFTTNRTNYIALLSASITIDGDAASWNSGSTSGQHIIANKDNNGDNQVGVADGSIVINAGDNVEANALYEYQNIVKNNRAGGQIGARHLVASTGLQLKDTTIVQNGQTKRGLIIVADIAASYGANMYRALTLSSLRRTILTQNILDTMTTKTFHSDRYYNQEVELRLLQYDMSRLTNRSSKFSKQTRKNQSKIDKTREKIAKLTLEQSKGQNLDKGYNNFEVIDQLDAIFIPYTGRRDWRFFALPYATHSYVDMGTSEAQEYAGGALFGLQRNLRNAGIFGGFLGYEFVNTDTELTGGVDTRIQTNSLQAGLNYFKSFSITSKVWEGFIKASVRGGVDMPNFVAKTSGFELKLKSDGKSAIPLVYNVGAEVKGGLTFYQFKRNSYVSPEVSLSYDMLGSTKTMITKPIASLGSVGNYRPLGGDEKYDAIYWHLPQIGAAVRYYKMWGNTFRTNLKAGIKYNMLNKQDATFRIGNLEDKGRVTLPAVYGNLAVDFIWMIKKNHELSFGYDGLFYASSFAKEKNIRGENVKTAEWFNGVTTNLNFKYAYWFGGTDYVTDKDGNAVSRSIAEGKKSKKSKKSKTKKKSKKSKKKVYYIDG